MRSQNKFIFIWAIGRCACPRVYPASASQHLLMRVEGLEWPRKASGDIVAPCRSSCLSFQQGETSFVEAGCFAVKAPDPLFKPFRFLHPDHHC
jgi:hypothetical protein